jgi:chromosome segregation ATPase
MNDRHVVPLMDEGEPITLADGRPGRVRRCGHCGGALSVPDDAAEIERQRDQVAGMADTRRQLEAEITNLQSAVRIKGEALREAQDAIGRLRQDLEDARMLKLSELGGDFTTIKEDRDHLREEITKLRAEQDNAGFIPWRLAQDSIDELTTEAERQRAEAERWQRNSKEWEAEVAKLQAALIQIADPEVFDADWRAMRATARQSLSQEGS